jgi:AcrR family transcriptional regulator
MNTGRTRAYDMTARAEALEDTRERILESARSAFMGLPYEEATLAHIAAEASVSHQTVLNHFSSKEGLFLAVGERMAAEIDERRGRAAVGDPVGAVSCLVDDYEIIGDAAARFDLLEDRFSEVGQLIRGARHSHRAWLEDRFAPWLDIPAAARRRRLALLEVATGVHTWKHLRRHRGFGRRATAGLMLEMVEAALGLPGSETEEAR